MNEIQTLILSSSIDYSTDLICIELEKRNIQYLRINRDQFQLFEITLNIDMLVMKIVVCNKTYIFRNQDTNAIYFRAPVFLRTMNKRFLLEEQVYKSQWNAFIRNLIVFDKIKWINNPVNTYRAENKIYQLAKAKEIGLRIPKTIVSNISPQLLSNKKYVIKSIDTAIFNEENTEMFMYTTIMTGEEIQNSDLSLAPVFLQEYLEDKVDMRITYVSGETYPVRILSNNKGINCDWRKLNKDELQYIPCQIPVKIDIMIQKLMQKLKLEFGGIDLIESKGDIYFIEVNPTGEWGWLESNTNLKIDKAIVDSLLKGTNQDEKN